MKILKDKLSDNGILVFNVHNSKPSLLCFQNMTINFFRYPKISSLSHKDVQKLTNDAGLEIIRTYKIGIFPKALHWITGRKVWFWIDNFLCKSSFFRNFASHVIYVCEIKKQPVL